MSKAIGIDLGTTNSCVSVMEGGVPVIIPNELGERTTPSVVAFTASGERLIGSAAKRQASVNAANTIASIKREMGTDWRKTMNGKAYSPQEISAMILRKLRQDAEDYLGETVSDAVITVPAYFNDMQRQATKDAGRIAGLNVLRIINEPTSAALAYGLNHGQQQKIMVYDLGGGTFDVSIIDIGEDVIEVMATAGDNHLGGDDFDAALVQWMVQDFQAKNHYDPTKDVTVKKRLEEAAEQAKKELSASEVAYVNLPFLAQHMGQPVHYEATITRSKFNELTRHLVDRTAGPVQQALNDAGIAPSELAMVLLVGGSTRIPAVQEKVKALTGKNPSKNINPDECVAQGAAIQAEALSSTTATSSLLLLDVTPLSLSIETMGGVATRLIERNSALPTSYSRVFTTAAPFQSSVEINVLQGERPMAADNKSIGKFKLKGIKRAMAGVPKIEVSFSLDTNGILTVSARDQDTGNSQSITISGNGKMSDAEIQQAIRDAEQHTAQAGMRREAIESLNQAQMLIGQTEALLASQGKQMPKEQKQAIKSKLSDLKKLTLRTKAEKMSADEVRLLQSATEALKAVVRPMMGNQM